MGHHMILEKNINLVEHLQSKTPECKTVEKFKSIAMNSIWFERAHLEKVSNLRHQSPTQEQEGTTKF